MKVTSILATILASASLVAAGKKCAPKYKAEAPAVVVAATTTTAAATAAVTTTTEAPAATTTVAPPPAPQEIVEPVVEAPVEEVVAPLEPVAPVVDEPAPAPAPAPQEEVENLPAPVPQQENEVVIVEEAKAVVVENVTAPAPVPQPLQFCTAASMDWCRVLAATDKPDFVRIAKLSEPAACLALANYPRQHYSGEKDLVWNNQLAVYATESAQYAADNDCSHCHTNSGSGTTWGQNLYTGVGSCADAYAGWVTTEALGLDPHNLDAGHFKNIVGFEVPYQFVGCGSASSTKSGKSVVATVCNYGLRAI
ncbi:hypothetical protein BDR26DRAFT_861292 [Obelidium mucronatum]|nr:hypothetical protein BDR26DRAFT_861292 [Obelidium mucronatum]